MSEITLVRNDTTITEADKDAARRFIFGLIDGLGERGRRQWRRFWSGLVRMTPGEIATIQTHRERLGWFHRKHMKLESRLFEEQERFENFKQFRNWLKVGAGHVDWYPGPKGGVVPIPRSISYAELEQSDMEEVHAAMVAFVRTPHAQKTMWPHQPDSQRAEAIEQLLAEFGEHP